METASTKVRTVETFPGKNGQIAGRTSAADATEFTAPTGSVSGSTQFAVTQALIASGAEPSRVMFGRGLGCYCGIVGSAAVPGTGRDA